MKKKVETKVRIAPEIYGTRTDHEFSGDLVVRIKKLAPGQEEACDELMADSPFELTLKDSVVKVEKIVSYDEGSPPGHSRRGLENRLRRQTIRRARMVS